MVFWNLLLVVLPMLVLIGVGYLLKILRVWDVSGAEKCGRVAGTVLVPAYVFLQVHSNGFRLSGRPGSVIFALIFLVVLFLFLAALVPVLEKNTYSSGVMIQNVFFSNVLTVGVPVAAVLCGASGEGLMAEMSAVLLPVCFLFSVFILELHKHGREGLLRVLLALVTNPVLIALVLGIVFWLLRIPMPQLVNDTLAVLSRIAYGVTMLTIGGVLSFRKSRGGVRPMLWSVPGKLLLVPLIGILIAVLLGHRGETLLVLAILFGLPVCQFAYPMVQQSESDEQLSAHSVTWTLALFPLTMTLFVLCMRWLGWIA